jgi:hypothetical protein
LIAQYEDTPVSLALLLGAAMIEAVKRRYDRDPAG